MAKFRGAVVKSISSEVGVESRGHGSSMQASFKGRLEEVEHHSLLLGRVSLDRAFGVRDFIHSALNNRKERSRFQLSPKNVLQRPAVTIPQAVLAEAFGLFQVSYVSDQFPRRGIVGVDELTSELRVGVEEAWGTELGKTGAIDFASTNNVPLMIGYEPQDRPLVVREFLIERTDPLALMARHSYGVRRYLRERIRWAAPIGKHPEAVVPELALRFTFESKISLVQVTISVCENLGSGKFGPPMRKPMSLSMVRTLG